jgi:phosphoglycerol transferase
MTNLWSMLRSAPIAGLLASAVTAFSSVWLYAAVKEAEFAWLVIAGIGLFLALFLLDRNTAASRGAKSRRLFRLYWAFIPAVIFCFWVYLMDTFGYFDWGSLLMHADEGAMTPSLVFDYLESTGPAIIVILAFLFGLAMLKARGTLTRRLDISLAIVVLFANPMIAQPIKAAVLPNPLGPFLAERFVPVDEEIKTASVSNAVKAGKQKNLLHIFIESAERTYLEQAEFGGVMDPLRPFEARGLSAHDMVQLTFTYNSIAGIVAANCGVPLFMTSFTTKRFLEASDSFLPGATCLGDALARRGYDQAFVSGWPKEFTGQGTFFVTHGASQIFGGPEVVAAMPGDGSPFGADDAQVLDFSTQLLRKFKKADSPFSLTVAVSGGHAIDGYLTKKCEGKTGLGAGQPNILHAAKCTNMLVAEFIQKAEAENLLENTIIVLQSDHLTQPSTVTDRLNKYKRRNFFSISGPGIEPSIHAQPSSTPDIFPTILQALGVSLKDGRAALGTSLLSSRPTLTGELGEALFNEATVSEDVLSRSLWQPKGKALPDQLTLRQ